MIKWYWLVVIVVTSTSLGALAIIKYMAEPALEVAEKALAGWKEASDLSLALMEIVGHVGFAYPACRSRGCRHAGCAETREMLANLEAEGDVDG